MKKLLGSVLAWSALIPAVAQVSIPGNAPGVPANYVGWNGAAGWALHVRHEGNFPIRFGTNLNAGVPIYRMQIEAGNNSPLSGRVSFGNDLGVGFVAQDRLHSHLTIAGNNFFRFSNPNTTTTGGFRVGQLNTQNIALFDQLDTSLFRFDIRSLNITTQFTKFTINNINQTNNPLNGILNYLDMPRVGIWRGNGSPTGINTGAMLHIGSLITVGAQTHRDWMNTGTYYQAGSDGMYVGLWERGLGDSVEAVIAWGDNPIQTGMQGERLKFKFLMDPSVAGFTAAGYEGVEVARMVSDGNEGRTLFNNAIGTPLFDPQNTVHIIGLNANGTVVTPGGNSGLRFQRLNSTTPVLANPGVGVLSVNANGDVIYVNGGGGGGGLGNLCTSPALPLAGNYAVPMGTFDFNFTSDLALQNKVNVGYPCNTTPLLAKFNATTAVQSNTVPGSPESITIHGNNTYAANLATSVGIMGEATNTSGAVTFARGIWGKAVANRDAIGVFGEATNFSGFGAAWGGYFQSNVTNGGGNVGTIGYATNSVSTNVGVAGTGQGGPLAVGGWFQATNATQYNIGVSTSVAPAPGGGFAPNTYTSIYPTANIALYASADTLNSVIPGVPNQYWAGWFDGDVFVNGVAYYPGPAIIASDRQFKRNIQNIENAADIVRQLKPSTYFMKTDNPYDLSFSSQKQYGFISQEVEMVLPDLVENIHKPATKDIEGNTVAQEVDYKGLNYIGFIALLTKNAQEQQQQLDEQKKVNELLQQQLNDLKVQLSATGNSKVSNIPNSTEVHLSDKKAIVLNQNVPNPFAENTSITYQVPVDFGKAQILFYTKDGKIIQTVDILTPGMGQLNVFADDLSSGVYTYTLVVDGKTIDSKKMVKQ